MNWYFSVDVKDGQMERWMFLMHVIPGGPQLAFQWWESRLESFYVELIDRVYRNLAECMKCHITNG